MDLKALLVGEESYSFLFEVIFRTLIMFIFLVITIRLSGKRGVKQLSIFEMVMIIALGSAAGDPMFYKNVGMLPAILVFALVLMSYKLIVFIITRSERIEEAFEGKAVYIIKNGEGTSMSVKNQEFASDEFFEELRAKNIDHFGQIIPFRHLNVV
ncbi:MAG TPA: YetF domain-containing protein [Edaphocola sp.]|nr:YetF domain-containing protein [Edaphocola sp.]